MDWRKILMDSLIASIITGSLGVIAVLISNGYTNKKGYEKIDSKIGDLGDNTLNRQHEDIEKSIIKGKEGIEKTIVDKTSDIYTKVDKINDITAKNETLYQNLNMDQKEVRNNVNKLVLDWEKTISDNKELKSQIDYLKQEKYELKIEKDKTTEKLNRLTKTIEVNDTLKYENVELRHEVDSLKNKNSSLINQNQKLLITNKDLLKKLDTAKRMLGIENIPQEQDSELNKEKEEDWGMEL